MSKISTYDNASPVTLSDRLIGTSVGATPANSTKNFLVNDLLTLFTDNINEVGKVSLPVRYAEAVVKGDPVYISGFNVGQNRLEVSKAEADDANKMPVIGLADADYSMSTNGTVIAIGSLTSVDLSALSPAPIVGDILYVKAGGGLTKTAPINLDLIQNVGIVSRTGATGAIEVTAIGRANALPNFRANSIAYGTSTGNPSFSTTFSYTEENITQGTTTFTGKTSISTDLLNIPLRTFADNAAALAGDLVANDIYKTATGEVRIVV